MQVMPAVRFLYTKYTTKLPSLASYENRLALVISDYYISNHELNTR